MIYIKGVPLIDEGIAQKEFTEALYYSPPEFSMYLNQTENRFNMSLALSLTQSKILMNPKVTNLNDAIKSAVRVQSLLNPDNIHDFFLGYSLQNFDDLKLRFSLNSNEQVEAMYNYLIDSI